MSCVLLSNITVRIATVRAEPNRPTRRTLLRSLAGVSAGLFVARSVWPSSPDSATSRAHDAGDRPWRLAGTGMESVVARLQDEEGEQPSTVEEPEGYALSIPRDVGEDEHWVDVNLTAQAATAMIGRAWSHFALVTTGKPGWDTPEGQYRIVRRVANETMTSAALGITDPNDQYVLTNVLYTQYFTWEGHALHLNYWRPDSVFGAERTSHGCVGMRLDDALYFWRHVGMGSRVVVHS
jgi:lipoprotein-anchoring transpeptidase ErfK/SrfK